MHRGETVGGGPDEPLAPGWTFDDVITQSEACRAQGDHRRGAGIAERAVAASRTPRERAQALSLAVLHHARLGCAEHAVRFGREALRLWQSLGERARSSVVHATLALSFANADMADDALAHAIEATRDAEAADDDDARFWAALRLGVAYCAMGEWSKATVHVGEAIDLARRNGNEEQAFAALNNQSTTLYEFATAGDASGVRDDAMIASALQFALEAQALAERSGNPHRGVVCGLNAARASGWASMR